MVTFFLLKRAIQAPFGAFLQNGATPSYHPNFRWDFPEQKPSIYWGTSMTSWNHLFYPIGHFRKLNKEVPTIRPASGDIPRKYGQTYHIIVHDLHFRILLSSHSWENLHRKPCFFFELKIALQPPFPSRGDGATGAQRIPEGGPGAFSALH